MSISDSEFEIRIWEVITKVPDAYVAGALNRLTVTEELQWGYRPQANERVYRSISLARCVSELGFGIKRIWNGRRTVGFVSDREAAELALTVLESAF